jgi:hypothetical protein
MAVAVVLRLPPAVAVVAEDALLILYSNHSSQ